MTTRTRAPREGTDLTLGLPPAAGKDDVVAFDFEIFNQGSRMHVPDGRLACLTFASPSWGRQVYMVQDEADVRAGLARVRKATLAAHTAAYDLRYLEKFGVRDVGKLRVWDTEIGAKLRDGGLYQTFALDDLARRDLDLYLDKSAREAIIAGHFGPVEQQYAAADAWTTSTLAAQQMADPDLAAYYWRFEAPSLSAVLALGPVLLDVDYWRLVIRDHEVVKDVMRQDLGFNPGSPQQVVAEVKKRLGLTIPNAQAETLEAQAGHELIRAILDYKESAKMVSTYGESWLADAFQDDDGTWKIKPGWKSYGAVTGRWSCEAPNLQNIPVRQEHRLRYAFPASKGRKRVKMDANQQEPRVLAFLSRDPNLLAALKAGLSTHVLAGRVIFHDPNFSKKDPRYFIAKIVNLAVAYDMSKFGLARQIRCTVDEADAFIQGYFRGLPGVQTYITRSYSTGHRLGYVRTPADKAIHVNPWAKNLANLCANYPIQGGAAEITKLAVSYIHQESLAHDWPFCVDLVVHDETSADVPNRLVRPYVKMMEACWQQAAAEVIPGIPFEVETIIGPTWGGERE